MTRRNRHFLPLLALSTATFTTVSAEMMPTGVLDQLGASLSVTGSTAGLLVTFWAVTIAVTSVPLVRATMSWQRKPLILVTLGIMTVANVMTALASTYALAMVSRIVGATAHGVFWAVVVAYAASLVPPERVGKALSIVLAGPTLANLVSLPAGAALAHEVGWRATFFAVAAACALCVLLVASVVPASTVTPVEMEKGTWDHSVTPVLWVACGGFFALVGFYALFTFVVPVSEAVAGIPAGEVPGVLLASGVGGVVGVLVAGRISDRWPTRALPVTVVALAIILGVTGFAHAPMAYILLAVLWGVMIGILPVVLQANVMRVASESFRPLAGSVLVTVLNLGVGLGAGVGSLVSSHDGLRVLPFIAAAIAALAIIPLIIFRLLRRNAPPSHRLDTSIRGIR
jgi:predicted MFS family arabinose efflux permease